MIDGPEELASILKREYASADVYHGDLSDKQSQALRYYEAQPFGNEVDGRSQIVLPDVQEVTDDMLASVLQVFTSASRVVEFEATNEDDEQAVDDATAAVNYSFMKQQDGFRILYDGAHDGLLKKIGIFKTVCETEERVRRETVTGDPMQLGELPEGVEVEDLTENEDGTVTAKLKYKSSEKRFNDYAIPTNEFRFSANARHEDTADYVCHVREVTRSELIEMGFDPEQVAELSEHTMDMSIREEDGQFDTYDTSEESSEALQRVLLCEEYARIDMDGDGIAERIKCYRVENTILNDAETGEPSIETVEEQPFSVFCPFPRPHRLVGYSLADKVMDLQLARSYVARQLFDGMALDNMPRMIVDSARADETTLADILAPIPGSPIRIPGGGSGVQPVPSSFNAGQSLQVLEWVSREKEGRSSVGRATPAADENSMNNLTATEYAGRKGLTELGQELVARNLAQALGRLFMKKYRLMRNEGETFMVKVDGQYKQVNPSEWPEDVNMLLRVGLGSGSKDKRIQGYMAMVPIVAEAMQNKLSTPKHAFNLMDGLARDMEIGQGDDYMTDPDAPPEIGPDGQPIQPEPEVDPEQEAMMAEQQAKQAEAQAKLQLEGQKAQGQAELARMKAEADVETTREKHAMDMQVAREKAELDNQLARERAAAEISLARERTAAEIELSREKNARDAELKQNVPGGDLDK